ncbi:MAG TPA: hypothetical protein VIL48_09935 [Acidimicrobiales bacterium]
MLGHAGGAATLDAPTWLLAYGAAACVLLATVLLRSRIPAAAPDREPARERRVRMPGWAAAAGRALGRVLGLGLLVVTVVAAFVGPDSEVVNFAPAAVLAVWWVGLPLACLLAGDVMAWLDPFGPAARLARRLPRRRSPGEGATLGAGETTGRDDRPEAGGNACADSEPGGGGPSGAGGSGGPRGTAPALLAAAAWWVLAYQGADSPRPLGAALLAYAGLAAAGARRWGLGWLRRGEAFGALSAGLAALGGRLRWRIRPESAPAAAPGPAPAGADADASALPPLSLVAVWLGAAAFDVFAGSGAWVDLAGASSGWARTGVATAALAVAVAAAGALVAGAARLAAQAAGDDTAGAAGRHPASESPAAGDDTASTASDSPAAGDDAGDDTTGARPAGARPAGARPGGARRAGGPADARRATVAALLAATAGVFLAHGLPLLLVDGQRTLAHASDPFGRGWDLFGTADRLTDYTPFTPTAVGIAQLALAVGANLLAVAAAWSRLGGAARAGRLRPAAAARAVWTIGLAVAILTTLTVAVLATDLE